MKKILFVSIFLLLFAFKAEASEVFGHISTDPKLLAIETSNVVPDIKPAAEKNHPPASSGNTMFILQNQNIKNAPVEKKARETELLKNSDSPTTTSKKTTKVLGVTHYPDGTLLRADDRKIYAVKRGVKKLISSFVELKKYQGQKIYNSTPEDLEAYQTRSNLEGELIRQKGTVQVYVIFYNKRKHILNLEELRAHFFGLEIFNISIEEMELY
jgi:hypothetical protein